MRNLGIRGLMAAFSLFLFAGLALGQTGAGTFGTILGTVNDETGAVVPKVTVTVTNERTGSVRTTATNEEGSYQVPALLPGLYRVELEASGFKKYQRTDVDLRVNESVRVDATMQSWRVDANRGGGRRSAPADNAAAARWDT